MNLEKYIEKLEVEKDFNLSQLTSFDKATKLQRTMNSKKKERLRGVFICSADCKISIIFSVERSMRFLLPNELEPFTNPD